MERAMIIEQFKRLNSYTSEIRANRSASLRESRPTPSLTATSPTPQDDEVVVSPDALLFSRAKEALKSVPEVREALVQRLREEIENGSYSVGNVLVAERLLEAVARFARL